MLWNRYGSTFFTLLPKTDIHGGSQGNGQSPWKFQFLGTFLGNINFSDITWVALLKGDMFFVLLNHYGSQLKYESALKHPMFHIFCEFHNVLEHDVDDF